MDKDDKYYMYVDTIRNELVFPNLPPDWKPDPEDVTKCRVEIVDSIDQIPFDNFDTHVMYLVIGD